MTNTTITYEELEQLGFNKWVVSSQKNILNEELNIGAMSGWQTFNSVPLPKTEDGTDFSLYFVPFNDAVQNALEDENGNKVYDVTFEANEDKTLYGASLFNEYYHGRILDSEGNQTGQTVKYAGFIKNLELLSVVNSEGEEIGKFLKSFQHDNESYLAYEESLPSRIPGLVSSKCSQADNATAQEISEGYVPNSASAINTFLTLDGEEMTETPKFKYNEANRDALTRAVLSVTNGAPSARVTFEGAQPVKMTREQVLRLYLEMEQFARFKEAYALHWKAMVTAHKNDDKHTADSFDANYVWGETPLTGSYQTAYEADQEDIMSELMAMAENWGINE